MKHAWTLTAAAALVLAACGGGDDDVHPLQGRWAGALAFREASDGCSAAGARDVAYDVSVSGSTVVAVNAQGLPLQGQLSAPEAFQAEFATASAHVDYREVLGFARTQDGHGAVTLTLTERSFALVCTRSWGGVLMR